MKYLYTITITFLTITGFAQMPIFKRYYIADIYGFGWLAKFYVTHYLHYLFAIIFIGLIFYMAVDYFLIQKGKIQITIAGYFKITILSGLFLTGSLLVIKNFAGTNFSPFFITFLDVLHLVLVMALLILSLFKRKSIK